MRYKSLFRALTIVLGLFASVQTSQAQRFDIFPPQVKTDFPSVVYDFLETYLYEIDSLQTHGEYVQQKLKDDKFLFLAGTARDASRLDSTMTFQVSKSDNKFYEVVWNDTLGNTVLDVAFPMQYELILGKPKDVIELEFKQTVTSFNDYAPVAVPADSMIVEEDSCLMSQPNSNYYVEVLNTATYLNASDSVPTYSDGDLWHSAANLFQGCIDGIDDYQLYIEQNLYGFQKQSYIIQLRQWLAYCQAMQLVTYFAVEEEREDGLKVLLVAQSQDLGFNHMLSIILPDNFVTNKKSVLKATLNAYIPTQNVKDLYQRHVAKPKKKI